MKVDRVRSFECVLFKTGMVVEDPNSLSVRGGKVKKLVPRRGSNARTNGARRGGRPRDPGRPWALRLVPAGGGWRRQKRPAFWTAIPQTASPRGADGPNVCPPTRVKRPDQRSPPGRPPARSGGKEQAPAGSSPAAFASVFSRSFTVSSTAETISCSQPRCFPDATSAVTT